MRVFWTACSATLFPPTPVLLAHRLSHFPRLLEEKRWPGGAPGTVQTNFFRLTCLSTTSLSLWFSSLLLSYNCSVIHVCYFSTFKKPNERLSQRFPLLFKTPSAYAGRLKKEFEGFLAWLDLGRSSWAPGSSFLVTYPHLLDDPSATSDFNQSKISSHWLFHIV